MLTSKQRSYLRSISSDIKDAAQIGKDGLTSNIIGQIDAYLEANELMKIKLQQNCGENIKETALDISKLTNSDTVAIIGRKIIIYRKSQKQPLIFLPRQ